MKRLVVLLIILSTIIYSSDAIGLFGRGRRHPRIRYLPLRVCLEWDYGQNEDIDGFWLYYSKTSEQYDNVVEIGPEARSVCIEDYEYFSYYRTFYLVITAFNDNEESAYSNEVQWFPTPFYLIRW